MTSIIGRILTSFDTLSLGAFRLRQIGDGQCIHLLIIPEVQALIRDHVAYCGEPYARLLKQMPSERRVLVHVVAWLLLSGIRTEEVQHRMMCEQSLRNIWRKQAFHSLLNGLKFIGKKETDEYLQSCIDIFLDRVDHHVESCVPTETDYTGKLRGLVQQNKLFLLEDDVKAIVREIIGRLEVAESSVQASPGSAEGNSHSVLDGGVGAASTKALESEQISEQEQEQEQEQEEEKEQEQEQEQEIEKAEPQQPVKKSYSRKDEAQESCMSSYHDFREILNYAPST